jgi:Domain of unknown function (DUF4148)
MKSLISAVAIVAATAALVAPVASFAQSNQPLTRADVEGQLAQLEKAGYNPNGEHFNYPAQIEAAQARVDAQNGSAEAANSGYGAPVAGTSQTGGAIATGNRQPVYFAN